MMGELSSELAGRNSQVVVVVSYLPPPFFPCLSSLIDLLAPTSSSPLIPFLLFGFPLCLSMAFTTFLAHRFAAPPHPHPTEAYSLYVTPRCPLASLYYFRLPSCLVTVLLRDRRQLML